MTAILRFTSSALAALAVVLLLLGLAMANHRMAMADENLSSAPCTGQLCSDCTGPPPCNGAHCEDSSLCPKCECYEENNNCDCLEVLPAG